MLIGCWSLAAAAQQQSPQELELGSPFLDDAVLQRQMKVPVWGWAKPGSTVTVTFAGQKKTAKADVQGEWKLKLDPLKASSEGRQLSVTASDGESVILNDILVGEVWFASGQSNMEWVAGKSSCRDLVRSLQASKEDYPIREYAVDIGSAMFPRSRTTSAGGWNGTKQAGGSCENAEQGSSILLTVGPFLPQN